MIKKNLELNETIKSNSLFLKELRSKLPEFFSEDKFSEEGDLIEEGTFDTDKFLRSLKEKNIEELTSGYQIDFIGKDYAKKQAGEFPKTIIVPDKEHNTMDINKISKNLFFTGDNLEVLRHLQNNYSNSIDLIYIDPPYNTGSDGFIYPDRFEYTDDNLKNMFGLNEKELERLKSIQGKATHSAWMTFMYPRLWLAKRLLKENGVILISIDDNEQANLTLLLNEVFGELNKFPAFIWKNRQGGGNDSTHVADETEYIIGYAKNINHIPKLFEKYDPKYEKRYKEEDELGKYYWDTFKRKSGKQYYPIKTPDGTILEYDEIGNKISWLRSEKRFINDLEEGEVKFVQNKLGKWNIHFKQRIPDGKKPRSIIADKGTTATGSQEILSYFSKEVFSNPKPRDLIKYLIEVFTEENATILDFFAGSGTTGDAVMYANSLDQKDRNYILVQLNEPTFYLNDDHKEIPKKDIVSQNSFSLGYRYIAEVSRARIKKASESIQLDLSKDILEKFDGGFKHYFVIEPDQPTLDDIESFDLETGLFKDSAGQLRQITESDFDDMITPFSSKYLKLSGGALGEDTIVTTWLAQDGYKFSADIKVFNIQGYNVYNIEDNRLYLIGEGWNAKHTRELLNILGGNQLNIQSIVVYSYSFSLESVRELEIGLKQLNVRIKLEKKY